MIVLDVDDRRFVGDLRPDSDDDDFGFCPVMSNSVACFI